MSQALLEQSGPRVLTTVEHTDSTIDQALPSWVTRWDVSLVQNDIYKLPDRDTPSRFAASPHSLPTHPKVSQRGHLTVQGIIVDKVRMSFQIDVTEQTGVGFRESSTGRLGSLKIALEDLSRESSRCQYNNRVDAFCRTLCIGATRFQRRFPRHAQCLAEILEGSHKPEPGKMVHKMEDETEAMVYYSEIKAICTNRSFIITDTGYFGLGPLISRPGDTACVIIGVDVAFMLRGTAEEGSYRLLGESYMHGLMQGQVRGMVQRNEVVEQSIVIC